VIPAATCASRGILRRMGGDFVADTRVEGSGGRYRAVLSPEWQVWGPLGGYLAAIALRALGAESDLPRPATFHCLFLAAARFGEVEIEVTSLRRGGRSQALAMRMMQQGRPVLAASGWTVAEGMSGLEHDRSEMPAVPRPEALRSYAELAENYDEWFPVWRTIDGRPVVWSDDPGPPLWQTWMRLFSTPDLSDTFLEAARNVMWLDLMMWNAASTPHRPWPLSHIAPNLDLAASFHASSPGDEWLLCDAHAPVGRDGLLGCSGRVWSPGGCLLASGVSTLFCRPNPELAPPRA
jgi:acyl-CoA thioesterase II